MVWPCRNTTRATSPNVSSRCFSARPSCARSGLSDTETHTLHESGATTREPSGGHDLEPALEPGQRAELLQRRALVTPKRWVGLQHHDLTVAQCVPTPGE